MCSCGLGHMLAFKPRPKTKENYCKRATEQSGKKKVRQALEAQV